MQLLLLRSYSKFEFMKFFILHAPSFIEIHLNIQMKFMQY